MAEVSSATHGYWGPRTASEDWCEPNYAISYYIAEFWNVMSSIPIALGGLWILYCALRYGYRRRFIVSGICFTAIGIGSCYFHGTLTYYGQVADELAMVYTMVSYFFLQLEDGPKVKRWWLGPALFLYALGFTLTYLLLPAYFIFFLTSFIAGTTLINYWAWQLYCVETDGRLKKQFWVGMGCWLAAFFVCWLPDKLACDYVRGLHLHAVFHIMITAAPFWLVFYIAHSSYRFELVRRLGKTVDEEGRLVPAPLPLLRAVRGDAQPLPLASPAPTAAGAAAAEPLSPTSSVAAGEVPDTGSVPPVAEPSGDHTSADHTSLPIPTYRAITLGSQILIPWVVLRTKSSLE